MRRSPGPDYRKGTGILDVYQDSRGFWLPDESPEALRRARKLSPGPIPTEAAGTSRWIIPFIEPGRRGGDIQSQSDHPGQRRREPLCPADTEQALDGMRGRGGGLSGTDVDRGIYSHAGGSPPLRRSPVRPICRHKQRRIAGEESLYPPGCPPVLPERIAPLLEQRGPAAYPRAPFTASTRPAARWNRYRRAPTFPPRCSRPGREGACAAA